MVDLINNNDVSASVPCQKFGGERMLSFNVKEANRDSEAQAAVYLAYPYPPKGCEDCLTKIQQLQDEIKKHNENIATGMNKNVGQRWIEASQNALSFFKSYATANKCQEQLVKAAEDAYTQEWQSILNAEQKQSGAVSGKDNWIVFGILGVLVLGTVVIIVKKSKS